MCQREHRSRCAHRRKPRRRAALEPELRRAAAPEHLDAAPVHPARMAGAERLHRCFLRGKPGGKRRDRVAPATAVCDLLLGEHALDEAVAVAVDGIANAGDLGCINARADDVHGGCWSLVFSMSYMTLPTVPESFCWTDTPAGTVLKCRPLDSIAPHLFTTRGLPLSSTDDWRRTAALLDAADTVTLNQVHGRDVLVIHRGTRPAANRQKADALVSDDPDVAIAVRAADCVPLLMADTRTGAVAAVHAGWRGTAAGAATAALDAMTREFDSRPEDVIVAIGPSIGACCYEVGSELVDAFAAAGHARHLVDRWFAARP